MLMVSHWAVVGFGSSMSGSFQSKKNDWETDQYRHGIDMRGVKLAYLGDEGDDVLAGGTSDLHSGDEQRNKGEEGKRWHCNTCRGGG
jgi:hypothetical protein